MNTLPPELLCIIFTHTTTLDDSNKTLRSISSVSRYIHAVAQPFLYSTVEVFGEAQMHALVKRLEDGKEKARVRDMFVADIPYATRGQEKVDDGKDKNNTVPLPPRPVSIPLHLFSRLLTLTAPSLRSLSLHFTSTASISLVSRLYRTPAPLLHTLSISALYPFPSTPRVWPSLRVLKLEGNKSPAGLLAMGGLAEACPRLESLEVKGLGMAGGFLREVEEALAAKVKARESTPVNHAEGEEFDDREKVEDYSARTSQEAEFEYHIPSRLPHTLKHLTLQAAPSPVLDSTTIPSLTSSNRIAGGEDMVALKYRMLLAGLMLLKLKEKDLDADVRVEVPERQIRRLSAGQMKLEWIGGLGSE